MQESNENEVAISQCDIATLSHGENYTLTIIATDNVGNVGEPTSYTWGTDFEPYLANTSSLCTSNLSPTETGQAQAVDDRSFSVIITYTDQKFPCLAIKTWSAMDTAGNKAILRQYYGGPVVQFPIFVLLFYFRFSPVWILDFRFSPVLIFDSHR